MSRPMIVPALLVSALCGALLAPVDAAPPSKPAPAKPAPAKPPNLKPLYGKLQKLQADIQKAQAEKSKELGKAQSDYMSQRAKQAAPLTRLLNDRQKVRDERGKELMKALDTSKASTIQTKYAGQIEEQKKKVAAKDAEIAKLVEKRNAELVKYETDWAKAMAEIAVPERKLAELQAQERADLHAAYGARARDIRATYDPRIDDLSKKVKDMEAAMNQANITRKADEAKVWAELHDLIAQLNPPEDRLELRRAVLVEERNELMALAANQAEKDVIWAESKIVIDALGQQIGGLKLETDMLWVMARQKVAAIEVAYRNTIAQIDPTEDGMEAQVADLRAQEWDQLRNLGNSPQANAVRSKYEGLMAPVRKQIQNKETDVAKHVGKKEEGRAKIVKNYEAQIARLNSRDNSVENKLFSLQAKEQAELHKAVDPEKAAAINAKFATRFTEVDKKIAQKQQEMAAQAQKHQDNVKKITAKHDTHIGKLQAEAAEVRARIQRGGR